MDSYSNEVAPWGRGPVTFFKIIVIVCGILFETIKSSVPFWRGQAQPTFSEASLRNIEVVSYDSNGEPVRFKATGVAGDTRSETYSAAQVVGKNPTIGKLFISMIKARDAARAQQSE